MTVKRLLWTLQILCILPCLAPCQDWVRAAVADPGKIATGQQLYPAGVQAVFDNKVFGVAFDAQPHRLWVLVAPCSVLLLDLRANRIAERHDLAKPGVDFPARPGNRPGFQGIRYDPELGAVATCSYARTPKENRLATAARVFVIRDGQVRTIDTASSLAYGRRPTTGVPDGDEHGYVGTLAVEPARRRAWLPLTFEDRIAALDLATGNVTGAARVGVAPFSILLSADGGEAYVSNWGGRIPVQGERSAPIGFVPDGDRVLVDERGVAGSGSISIVNTRDPSRVVNLEVGLHPSALALDSRQGRLYVANANSDTISILDLASRKVTGSIQVVPFRLKVPGVTPTALLLSPDARTLYVACAAINAVAVVDVQSHQVRGLIPTGWYPVALAQSSDGRHVAVANLLGVGSGVRPGGKVNQRSVWAFRGSVSVFETPGPDQLVEYTTTVRVSNRTPQGPVDEREPAPEHRQDLLSRLGREGLLRHVVFIIKENRTYDQILGDLPRGNGDPSLVMYGPDVTPNARRLATDFVLFDNFYASGLQSADGHQWLTQGFGNDYAHYEGWRGRSNPFDGSDPMMFSPYGFLWTEAVKKSKTVRVYGEFAGYWPEAPKGLYESLLARWEKGDDLSRQFKTRSPIESLNQYLAVNYPPYTHTVPDVVRASIFLKDLAAWESSGQMPNLVILHLPNDHTVGTMPSMPTPKALVADNDYATGLLVEKLSRTRFWRQMAVFIVEDDGAGGVDHVDGHRIVALVASPYARRGHLDSRFYAHPSLVRSIQSILGLSRFTIFDRIASDLSDSFTETPDFTPYEALRPRQRLDEITPPLTQLRGERRRGAQLSLRLNFLLPDESNSEELACLLWRDAKGWARPCPLSPSRVALPGIFVDEDENEDDSERPISKRGGK